jgi:hypothetical protein
MDKLIWLVVQAGLIRDFFPTYPCLAPIHSMAKLCEEYAPQEEELAD